MNKKYRHVEGFGDLTDHVLVEGGNARHVYAVRRDGSRREITERYDQDWIDQTVRSGAWEEVE